jgi:histidine ammonia-lyase
VWTIRPGQLTLDELRAYIESPGPIQLDPPCLDRVDRAAQVVSQTIADQRTVYGVNTGFGLLADQRIDAADLQRLQSNLILSHAAGTGPRLDESVVRLSMLLKVNSLACGYSGVRRVVLDYLIDLLNADLLPVVPSKGSVGASGDLAPLAHISCALLGVGQMTRRGEPIDAAAGLRIICREPLTLAPKEGLALINGTQVSTALAIQAWHAAQNVFAAAVVVGAMSVDAAMGSDTPFDERLNQLRNHAGQLDCARAYRRLLAGSEIRASHAMCSRVQDPYSLRCQPQVMGACLEHMRFVAGVLEREANAISDNPIVLPDSGEILSGGNFHAQPVAMAADSLALAIAEIGALAERRIALLIDRHLSQLPAFLVADSGLNSGFMIAQVTAAALASENKSLAHPASVDSLPTSANQEDHVSMATFAARRLAEMADNTATIVAIEWLAAAQGIDLRRPLRSSTLLEEAHARLRGLVSRYDADRWMAPDIAAAKELVTSNYCRDPRFGVPSAN